jgi:Holliday junction DNA helicase RuvA
MISRIKGTLLTNDLDRIEVETASGLVYRIEVPLTVLERLPQLGASVEIRTVYVVREDSATLYGFTSEAERELFTRLMGTSGVGAKLALAMMSTFAAHRLAQAIAEKDVPALTQVPGIGRKTAERLVLDLADKVQDLALAGAAEGGGAPAPKAAQDAVAALVALGFSFADADQAVRAALREGETEAADELIRRALARRAGGGGS